MLEREWLSPDSMNHFVPFQISYNAKNLAHGRHAIRYEVSNLATSKHQTFHLQLNQDAMTIPPTLRALFATILSCLSVASVSAEDWPMYRHDAERRGVTPASMPKNPQLAWSIELPLLKPAFHNSRLQFDAGYEPVVAGQHLLVASSRTDSVTAYDTRTGEQLWRYYTDGPVRFAPAVWQDQVCFGSDDGCLYCVVEAGQYGNRVAAIHCNLQDLRLPPYITTVLTSEQSGFDLTPLLQTLRPFGGIAIGGKSIRDDSAISTPAQQAKLASMQPGNFTIHNVAGSTESFVHRSGPLPGTTYYSGDWAASQDELVRFPLGVLWFDDTLAHFKRSPQPRFDAGTMISRPKDWHKPRQPGASNTDYPLLPPVLSDIYTGRVLDDSERIDLRNGLTATSPAIAEPSQYRPPRQKDAFTPAQPIVGQRINPLTGELEPRAFPKTYGCDGGVDYGDFFTMRSGTPAFYDKTIESGTVFISGIESIRQE